jgi:phosphate transport system permease protein
MATATDNLPGSSSLASVLRRRHRVDRGMTVLLTALMIAIGALLVWVLAYVAIQGLQALNWGFITDTPPGNPSDTGGGFANGIVGSLIIVGLATLAAVPFGIGCAIYLNQYATGRIAHSLRLVTDVMLGIPTIVTGAFVYALWVVNFGCSG